MTTTKRLPAGKVNLQVWLRSEIVARLDALAKKWTERRPGVTFTRSDMVREALLRGLAGLETEGK